ncbi:MAG: secondary thiamine-phosphate synthase enzyme YjbQ [Hyphomicrobiaceae bacterium]
MKPATGGLASEAVAAGMGLAQASGTLEVPTRGPGFYDITAKVGRWLESVDADEGLLTVFIRHTSASLVIQENADPDVHADLMDTLDRLAPQHAGYRHGMEGPDDMPAHIRSMLTAVSLGVPVLARCMRLGTWQGLYVVEHRRAAHAREVALHFMGRIRR